MDVPYGTRFILVLAKNRTSGLYRNWVGRVKGCFGNRLRFKLWEVSKGLHIRKGLNSQI